SRLPIACAHVNPPHLKLSFRPPLPLGFRSRAEVFDLELCRPPAVDLREGLNAALPEGLSVLAFRPILFKTPSLMSQLEGASYRVRFPASYLAEARITPETLGRTLRAEAAGLLDRPHVVVRRQSEAQTREFDARPSIASLEVRGEGETVALDAHLRFMVRAQVRPDALITLLIPGADARTSDVE